MKQSITLQISQAVLEKAQEYAKVNNIELDQIFEAYLAVLIKPQKDI